MREELLIILAGFLLLYGCTSDKRSNYDQLNRAILKGWNTWDNRSILTQVLLPEGLALTLQLKDTLSGDTLRYAFTGNTVKGAEYVRPLAHTTDGSYTDFLLYWRDFGMRIQSVAKGDDLTWLITPDATCKNPGYITLTAEMFYHRPGEITQEKDRILVNLDRKTIVARSVAPTKDNLQQPLNAPIAFSTRDNVELAEIMREIRQSEQKYHQEKSRYGELSETWNAMHNALNWLVVYDPEKNRAITPVSRPWAYGWGDGQEGGYVLFCWDNFFASFMYTLHSKERAFNEAIQMCREIDELGFVPNFSAPRNLKSRDRSQPPVGSMMVLEIYKKFPEKWFLEEVFDRLLTWNRWWEKNRDHDGYLCWGSNPFKPIRNDPREMVQNEFQAAAYESGLDNSPMFDDVPFDTTTHLLQQADVGLMGLYIGDCEALGKIASILGREKEAGELKAREEKYQAKLQTLWDDDFGLFLNKRLDTGELSRRISPTNFYALIGKAATQEQAERMINEHFYNPKEFWGEWVLPSIARNDPAYTGRDYWRGSIWAPMNFLVYLGLRNYDLPQTRKDLAKKSNALLLKQWQEKGYVRENYHAETGGDPGANSDHFYHWGALLGMIALLENGYH
ncbi:MAG: trehalase family glycosidase [candidate division KSB1 bacterium]|nr:trehalase family glycosidase [candidate division KSB1 bacterium]MDZ7342774.1 trehalase family glycosidase [candidate division KSB1 bacterium]